MHTFTDENGLRVDLFFGQKDYVVEPKHVLAVIKKDDYFLCTIHKKRGIEFPGGKLEINETLEQAVVREVLEETGIEPTNVKEIGYYVVHDEKKFSKAIFFSNTSTERHNSFELETVGRVWLTEEELWQQPNLSFYMKDQGMKYILQEVRQLEQQRNNI